MLDKSKSDSDTRKAPTNVPWAVVIDSSAPESETHPGEEAADTEPEMASAGTEPETVEAAIESESVDTAIEPEAVSADTELEVAVSAIEPEAVDAAIESEPVVADTEPETDVAVIEPEPLVAAIEPESVAADTEPETVAADADLEIQAAAAEPELEAEAADTTSEAPAEPDIAVETSVEAEEAPPPDAHGEPGLKSTEDQKTASHAESTAVPDASCDDAVIRSLMDVLITPAGMVQPQERAFAADLLLHVIEYATPQAKQMLCDRLSNMPDAPATLITRFINDPDLALSATLLLNASCVSDSELITVVENADRDRSLLVAKRQHLSAAVGTALAKTGDLDLAMALVRNPYVQLSQEALQRLADMALEHEELIEPLVMRTEMTAACALYLFWSMPARQRSYVLGRFLAEVQVLPQILVMSKPGADLVAAALRASADAGNGKAADAAQTEKPSKHKAADMVEALESGCADNLASVIEKHAAIEAETTARIVGDTGGEPLTVACKALGVSRFAFGDAIAKWQAGQGLEANTEALQLLFDTLSFKQARMALTYWEWQTQGIGPYRDAYPELSR